MIALFDMPSTGAPVYPEKIPQNLLTELDEDKVVVGGGSLKVILGQHKHAIVVLDLGGQGGGHEQEESEHQLHRKCTLI